MRLTTQTGAALNRRRVTWHRSARRVILAAMALVACVNLLLSMFFWIKDNRGPVPGLPRYEAGQLAVVYPGLTAKQVENLQRETWLRPFLYDPFTQFKESAYRGQYVNVSAEGFRAGETQGPWPLSFETLNVFFFGGSTTFGYGVADAETIPSYFQQEFSRKLNRRVHVYNFGRGYYYSTQERILFEHLLSEGHVPGVAIFVDGLNDFFFWNNEPQFTPRMRALIESEGAWPFVRQAVAHTAFARASRAAGNWISPMWRRSPQHGSVLDQAHIDAAIRRYFANKKAVEAVSNDYGVTPIFVWQPVSAYGYDARFDLFPVAEDEGRRLSAGYEHMANVLRSRPWESNFFWCADLQRDARQPLYVDGEHYSAQFSRQIASHIADLLVARYSGHTVADGNDIWRGHAAPHPVIHDRTRE